MIHPTWIHKYRESLPPVWVAFYDLWDWSVDELERPQRGVGGGPLGAQVVDPMEREKETAIVTEIVERHCDLALLQDQRDCYMSKEHGWRASLLEFSPKPGMGRWSGPPGEQH